MLLVDVSGSMNSALSGRSEMRRMDAAAGLAVLAREVCESVRVFSFSDMCVEVPAYRGLALAESIVKSQPNSGTLTGDAVNRVNQFEYDRVIIITDEQSHQALPNPTGLGYCINVASAKPGLGYGAWHHIDGWSEAVLTYVRENERASE
jgi:hypothetical protein